MPSWFRAQRPSPSMIVAVVAVVVACTSTAVAASVMITSSAQIKDGIILGRDLQARTLTGRQLLNNSFGAEKLTPGARNALRGPRGATGARGPIGRRGVAGPEGGDAISLLAYPSATVGIAPGAGATGNAACPTGLRPTGGGARNPDGKLAIVASYPVGGAKPGWAVTALNPDTAEHPLIVDAVCARVKRVS